MVKVVDTKAMYDLTIGVQSGVCRTNLWLMEGDPGKGFGEEFLPSLP